MKEGQRRGDRYRAVKRGYKELRERKRREKSERWTKLAKNARTEGQVWMIINREKKKRRNINGIKIKERVEF